MPSQTTLVGAQQPFLLNGYSLLHVNELCVMNPVFPAPARAGGLCRRSLRRMEFEKFIRYSPLLPTGLFSPLPTSLRWGRRNAQYWIICSKPIIWVGRCRAE